MKGFKKLLGLKKKGKGDTDTFDSLEEDTSAISLGGSTSVQPPSVCLPVEPPASESHITDVDAASLPPDVKLWQVAHVQAWLSEEFKGAEDLPKYLENFRRIGVRGADLLTADKKDVAHFGITDRVHVRRFESALKALSDRQKNLTADGMYAEMKRECDALRHKKYVLPQKMQLWSVVDVMYFITDEQHAGKLDKLVRPLILNRTTGEMLVQKCKDIADKQKTALNDAKFWVDSLDITLKCIVDEYNDHQKAEANRKKTERGDLTCSSLPPLGGTIQRGLKLGSGSYADVYLVRIARTTAVEKIPLQTTKTENEEEVEFKSRLDLLTSEAWHEARMMLMVPCPGVLRLLHVFERSNYPPSLILEFMCNKSLQYEYESAARNNVESIFHKQHEGNLLQAEGGMSNPVLVQMVRVARDIASALVRIHAHGVIHLDIAARNILLDAGKRPKIGDFGLAAIESEMVEQYELIKTIVETGGNAADMENKILLGIADLECGDIDEFVLRRNGTRTAKRPDKWMPEWVVDRRAPANPRLDRHADIYSFGCVMYEIASGKIPHKNISPEELVQLKLSGRGNPPIPPGIDPSYARIMSSCWVPREKQPKLDTIAIQLSDLYKELLRSAQQEEDAYREFKTMSSALFPVASDVMYTSVTKVLAKQKDRPSFMTSLSAPTNFPKIANGRVRFNFPESLDSNDVSKFYEYRDEGLREEKVDSTLKGAFSAKDAAMIANYMTCIAVENSELQVKVLAKCMKYLELLAQDEHGDTDSNELQICGQIVVVAQSAEMLLAENSISSSQRTQLVELIVAALGAMGSLVKAAVQEYGERTESDAELARQLTTFTLSVIQSLVQDAPLVEKGAFVISALVTFDENFDGYASRAACLLLRAIDSHGNHPSVIIACAKALKKFALRTLCDLDASTTSKATNSPAAKDEIKPLRSVLSSVAAHVDNTDSESEEVVEACFNAMFLVCVSGAEEPEWIEKFFFALTAADIEMMFVALNTFPDNFRIQESIIGLLAYIVSSGTDIEEEALVSKKNVTITFISPTLPAADRMATLLRCDAGFSVLLNAMDRFAVDDKSLLDSRRMRGQRKQGISVSRGMHTSYSSRMVGGSTKVSSKSKSQSMSSTPAVDAGASSNSNADEEGAKALLRILNYTSVDKLGQDTDLDGLLVDKEGDHLTAASLQRSVAMIIGTACNFSKEVQELIAEHNFHVLILHAFQTFSRNNLLFQSGCHALFSTCRGNRRQQRRLHDLNILNNLCKALNCHQRVWEVADAAICVITGLLEPVNKRKPFSPAEMKSSDSFQVAELLTDNQENDKTVLAWICRAVAEFQIDPECHQLTCNFLRLLSSLLFWVPGQLMVWQEKLVILSDEIARAYATEWLKVVAQHSEEKMTEGDQAKAKSTLQAASSKQINLFDFVRLSFEFHESACHVVGAGLALFTMTAVNILSGELIPFGEDLPYKTNRNLVALRQIVLEKDIFNVLLQGSMVRGEDHWGNRADGPTVDIVRIRHTFWLAIILISERRQVDEFSVGGAAMRIAADMSIKKFVEWAVDVVVLYPRCYSLQCLAIKFLIWMEHHGHFQSRQKKLKELQALLPKVRARTPADFMSLDEEGYDTSMFGKTIDVFGKLHEHADRLLLLLNIHLKSAVVEEVLPTWDGRCSPYSVRVVGFETEEDPATLHRYNTYVIEVIWDEKLQWTIPKRFSFFTDLQTKLLEEFSCIDVVRNVLVKPNKRVLSSRTLESKQACREMLDTWIKSVTTTRAVLFSANVLSFIGAYDRVPGELIRRPDLLPANEQPLQQSHPVTCVVSDSANGLYFVGCGVLQSALTKMFSKVSVRGTVSVFDLSPATAGRGRAPLAVLRFSVGVMKLAWDPSSRCLCIGLATGPIILYELSSAEPYTLTYFCEVNSHTHPICFLALDHASRMLYSASLGGLIEAFSTENGKVISQVVVKTGTQITAVAMMSDLQWMVCGTNAPSLLIYDMTKTTSVLLSTFALPSASPASVVSALAFVEESHFLYVAVDNTIHLLQVPFTVQELGKMPWNWSDSLTLRPATRITHVEPILQGKYLAATSGPEGSVVVFAMTKRVRIVLPKIAGGKGGENGEVENLEDEKAPENNVITAMEQQATWQKAVHFSNFEMRLWFQGQGVDSSEARTRSALLKLMAKTCKRSTDRTVNITAADIAKALVPVDPSKDVLFSYQLRMHPRDSLVYISALMYIDDLRSFALGCSDGFVQLLSLADFMPLATTADKNDLLAHFNVPVPPVKGSTSTNGKRLQM